MTDGKSIFEQIIFAMMKFICVPRRIWSGNFRNYIKHIFKFFFRYSKYKYVSRNGQRFIILNALYFLLKKMHYTFGYGYFRYNQGMF